MSAAATPSVLVQRLARAGFVLPTLVFALRTATAAFVALAIAYALGLEHPHWAAMSAWACSQPTREHLFSRGLYRVGGSVVGVAYAVMLVLLAQGSIVWLAVGLAAWGAACAFVGNLQRGFMVYGCMLAGYSAAMVVLLHHGPAHDIGPLAMDRMLTVLAGVVTAVGISWFFSPRRQSAVLIARSRQVLAQVLEAFATQWRTPAVSVALPVVPLQAALAQVEELLELYPEGSRTASRTAQALRAQLHDALEVVYQLALWDAEQRNAAAPADHLENTGPAASSQARDANPVAPEREALVQALLALARALNEPPDAATPAMRHLEQALEAAHHQAELEKDRPWAESDHTAHTSHTAPPAPGQRLAALLTLLQTVRQTLPSEWSDLAGRTLRRRAALIPQPPVVLEPAVLRDWVGARQAGIRAGAVLLAAGMVWAATGSQVVSFGMLGLSVMLLVFSNFENPQRTMAFVLRGQVIGAVLALACLGLAWPWARSGWMMVAMLLPFMVVGGLLFGHQRTAGGALDTNMVMLILLAPVFPYHLDWAHSLSMAIAVVCGPAMAWLVYGSIFPTNAQRRMNALAQTLAGQVPALARRLLEQPPHDPARARACGLGEAPRSTMDARTRARQHHGLLRLMRWAGKAPTADPAQAAHFGVALRCVESSMCELHRWSQQPVPNAPTLRRAQRQVRTTLQHMAQWRPETPDTSGSGRQDEAVRAWEALAHQPALPPRLAANALRVARTHLPALCSRA